MLGQEGTFLQYERTETHTEGEGQGNLKAEIGVMLVRASECQQFPAEPQQLGNMEQILPAFSGNQAPGQPDLRVLDSRTVGP